jgi:hypothetical protein
MYRAESDLYLFPQVRVDDSQVRPIEAHHVALVAGARSALVRARHLDPLRLFELPDTDIALVIEHRADGRGSPAGSLVSRAYARRWDAVCIQRLGNGGLRAAVTVHHEDPYHDGGQHRVDLDAMAAHLAVGISFRDRAESIGRVACRIARAGAAFEPA